MQNVKTGGAAARFPVSVPASWVLRRNVDHWYRPGLGVWCPVAAENIGQSGASFMGWNIFELDNSRNGLCKDETPSRSDLGAGSYFWKPLRLIPDSLSTVSS